MPSTRESSNTRSARLASPTGACAPAASVSGVFKFDRKHPVPYIIIRLRVAYHPPIEILLHFQVSNLKIYGDSRECEYYQLVLLHVGWEFRHPWRTTTKVTHITYSTCPERRAIYVIIQDQCSKEHPHTGGMHYGFTCVLLLLARRSEGPLLIILNPAVTRAPGLGMHGDLAR